KMNTRKIDAADYECMCTSCLGNSLAIAIISASSNFEYLFMNFFKSQVTMSESVWFRRTQSIREVI
ncbi:MAG: hypothetical protein BV458_10850, partial [Thermoplasmata archaeon M9B2D]